MPGPRPPRRLSLAAQLLVLQLVILLGALGGVLWLSISQSLRTFESQESRRTLSAAESLAATPLVRALLPDADASGRAALAPAVESVRAVAGLTEAAVIDAAGSVVSSSDVTLAGEPAPSGYLAGDAGRAWTGTTEVDGRSLLLSRVPVFAESGERIGLAVAARAYPGWPERLGAAVPDILVALVVFGAVGLGGSYLLSRRLKRQTLGMEPGEIAAVVEHREALLRGVKEGVVAVDTDGRITALNDAARALLGWHDVREGRTLEETGAPASVLLALAPDGGRAHPLDEQVDAPLVVGDRLVVANRRPLRSHGRDIGAVTTLRDRTELIALEDELGASRMTAELLRAQTHEFANQLHTVAGLIQIDQAAGALQYISGIAFTRSALVDSVTDRIADAPLAALLIAASSAAAERHVVLRIDEDSRLEPVPAALSRDLITVVGNLVDNAVEAASGTDAAAVDVDVRDAGGVVTITVQDSGPGLEGHDPELLFRRGFSTKPGGMPGGRGYGLALTRQVCRRRGGDATARERDGAVFVATLPREEGSRPA
ncbi:ATP-binding protein [Microbacterium betulae]|uniref:histidine kinase n=1 Tax=Microbacterium betulae TaxID=2981139 RepID=A0AA97I686_9MICO|nr:ATP-binding protein [Microbacterium sp. AB]WOF23579.1 ATP-binding protein [Microbacterium sp. AB]